MPMLIDTCVLRELHLPRPFWRVRRAVDDLWWEDVHLSIVTFAILEAGLMRLPQEFKQRRVRGWILDVKRKLGANLHGIDYETGQIWGQITASAAKRRLRLPPHDALMAATAKRYGFTMLTRNMGYFAPFNIEVMNPWGDPRDSTYDYGNEADIGPISPGTTSFDLAMPRDAGDAIEAMDEAGEAAAA